MLRKIFISALFVILTIGFGQEGRVSFTEARLVPKMLNYQGYLTDTLGIPIIDTLNMTFSIFDALTSGNQLWTETQTNVSVDRGIFNVALGSVNAIPDSVFTQGINRWLELTVAAQTLSPRTRITAMGYAYTATYSDTAEYARNAAADNDWTISGNDLYSAVSGFVGIGTSSPTEKLDVAGDIRVNGTASSGDTAIDLRVGQSTSGKGGAVYIKAGDAQNNYSANHWGGDVNIRAGIGQNNSGGDVLIEGGLTSIWTQSTNPTTVDMYGGGIDGAPGIYNNSGLITIESGKQLGANSPNRSGGHILLLPGEAEGSGVPGNVGIGITSPARKLHVNDVMRLEPRASAPASPAEGDMYMDSTTHTLMVYDGTTWQACW